jgi:hypothetical protein
MLRQRFGPEYERAVQAHGFRAAERMLAARVRRVERSHIRELSDFDRDRFLAMWNTIQAQFVDDPRVAVRRANELIVEVMRARGYSADDGFEQRADDLSVDHPEMVEHYRVARTLARAGTGKDARNSMSTEELRQAVVHFRALFADLLEPSRAPVPVLRPAHA